MSDFMRSFPLEDIAIRSGGDGRTVEAYAAVFNTEVPISDQQGDYVERIAPTAFDKTLMERGTNFGVLFNHGMTIYGTPSDRGSMPIGTPVEVRADARGLFTVTRYNMTPLADEALEAIRAGSITAQSFQGRFIKSDKPTPRGGFRADKAGDLTVVTRTEIAMKEYGPAVFAAYPQAAIVGVRAAMDAGLTLSPTQTALLEMTLANLAAGDAALDPIVDALCATDAALDQAQMIIADILGVENPDPDPGRSSYLTRLQHLAVRLDEVASARTTSTEAGTGEPIDDHSARFQFNRARLRARAEGGPLA